MTPPSPTSTASEARRIDHLRELFVLDSEPEPAFDAIARLATEICGAPIALISPVDEERQWFKANIGLPGVRETPRDVAFCAHAIQSDELFEVTDAARDERFAHNPLVVGSPDIRFYAGAPLVAGQRRVPVSHMVIAHRGEDQRIARFSAVMRDISAEVQAKQAALRQSATMRSVTEAIPALVAVLGADQHHRFVNTSFERWCGSRRDAILGRSMAEVLGHAEFERSRPWVHRVLSGETVAFEKEYTGRQGTKHLSISYIPTWLEDGGVDGFVAVAQDITPHNQEQGRRRRLSQCDPLTGLLNRAGFAAFIENRLAEGEPEAVAVLYVDLDEFKPVNDRHGHPVGDLVLQEFATRLRRLVRPTDAVARLGGDEFAVVLQGVRERLHAHAVADKVVAAARVPFEVASLSLRVGASVGVALGAGGGGAPDLVARADAMLYRAKQAGRGRAEGES